MNATARRRFALLLAGLGLITGAAGATGTPAAAGDRFVEIAASADTLRQLRAGGFVLYLRHGKTDNRRNDRLPSVDLDDCASQRPLTAEGRRQVRRVGAALRQARIPLGEIHSSPLCRARDSAAAAFPGRALTVDKNLMYTANLTDAQKAPILANTRRLLVAPVAAGSNRVVVAHAPNLMDLIGYFPKESTLVIFRPATANGGDLSYVASIPPGRWPELLR